MKNKEFRIVVAYGSPNNRRTNLEKIFFNELDVNNYIEKMESIRNCVIENNKKIIEINKEWIRLNPYPYLFETSSLNIKDKTEEAKLSTYRKFQFDWQNNRLKYISLFKEIYFSNDEMCFQDKYQMEDASVSWIVNQVDLL